MSALTGRPVMQKAPPVRYRSLLDLAHDMPCFATFAHDCNQNRGCHPAHANWLKFQKGVGLKATDWAFASMCGNAHREIDGKINPTMSREAREAEWMNAFIATHNYLWSKRLIQIVARR